MSETAINPYKLRRQARRLLLPLLAVAVVYGFARFGTLSLPAGNDAMRPTLPTSGTRLLIDRYPGHARELQVLDIVVYRAEVEGRRVKLVGRVRALPGDTLGERDGVLTINDTKTAFSVGVLAPGVVPPSRLLILNENSESKLADGRQVGLVAREHILGRVVTVVPTGG